MVLAACIQFLVFNRLLLHEEKTQFQTLTYEMRMVIFLLSTSVFKHGTYSMELLEHGSLIDSLFSVDRWLNYEMKITYKPIKFFKVVYRAKVIKKAAQLSTELVISLAHIVNRNSFGKKMVKLQSSKWAGISYCCLQTSMNSSFILAVF